MTQVRTKPNESVELAVRRFKRACDYAGIITDVRKKEFYEKPTWARKRVRVSAVKRSQRQLKRERQDLVERRQRLR